ncbi:MAG TPA: folate family ECF transporter S component, partial [Bacteroidales bacterium]|nr:folate family ECF transporter S component [Bacteroidales bacterium]
MEKMIDLFKLSMQEVKKTKVIAFGGMLIAFSVVLSFFKVPLGPTLQISFASLPIAAAGMLFGPFVGGIVGFVSDILGYIVRPHGFFFPGFTLNAILIGAFFGFFLYKKKITLTNVIISSLFNTIIINLGLTTLWLSIMYGDAF